MKAPSPGVGPRNLGSSRRRGRWPRALLIAVLAAATVSSACGGPNESEPDGDGDGNVATGGSNQNGDGDGNVATGGSSQNGDGDVATGGSSQNGDGDNPCAPGSEGCECYGNGTCDGSLACFSDLCVDAGGDGDGDTEMGGARGDGDGDGDGDVAMGGSAHECDCDDAQACIDGDCIPLVCIPDAPACDGDWARWCNAAGTGYVPGGTVCDSDESCEGGVCKEQICTPALLRERPHLDPCGEL
jgi:hypothetical protein